MGKARYLLELPQLQPFRTPCEWIESTDLRKQMESYELDLHSFRKATRLCDFIDCWPERVEPPPQTELQEFVA